VIYLFFKLYYIIISTSALNSKTISPMPNYKAVKKIDYRRMERGPVLVERQSDYQGFSKVETYKCVDMCKMK